MTTEITPVYDAVRFFREFMDSRGSAWKTPTSVHLCLLFACSEIGEVVDAVLRQVDYVRTDPTKQVNEQEEIADVTIVLATALTPDCGGYGREYVLTFQHTEWDLPVSIEMLGCFIWQALAYASQNKIGYWHTSACSALQVAVKLPQFSPNALVEKLLKFYWLHCPDPSESEAETIRFSLSQRLAEKKVEI